MILGGNTSQIGGKHHLILLTNKLLQAFAEDNFCTKFVENRPNVAISGAQLYI